tara:strand:- start:1343 stop:2206 length:864 start_codon:yes stop_codon:yes gene_type:complete
MKLIERKSMLIRPSGRSSDYITPSFGFGCEYKCSYCYMRRHRPYGLEIATNTQEIIEAIERHSNDLIWPKIPNQTHNKYYTYDFSCNEDYVKHARHHNWRELFTYFKNSDKIMGTAATKYVNEELLSFNPNKKVRIRFSLMPQVLADKLEPGTSKIIDRIKAVNKFYDAGYDVHLNYSPVIIYDNAREDYKHLFKLVDKHVRDEIKQDVKCEVIFLTHNTKMHDYNVEQGKLEQESLLWRPKLQETKVSSYGSVNIRYQYEFKRKSIDRFKKLHHTTLPWQEIRYIF